MASAPARVCLAGEDLDWLGGGSILSAVELRTAAEVTPRTSVGEVQISAEGSVASSLRLDSCDASAPEGHVLSLAALCCRYGKSLDWLQGCSLRIASDVPPSAGLASSAALCVAVLSALSGGGDDFDPDRMAAAAFEVEAGLAGRAVGRMDHISVARGGTVLVEVGSDGALSVSDLTLPERCAFLIVDSGEKRDTDQVIRWKRDRWTSREPKLQKYVDETTAVVADLRARLSTPGASILDVGAAMNHANRLMVDQLQVGTTATDLAVEQLMSAGAVGAKITGTGFGGCVVGLVDCLELDEVKSRLAAITPFNVLASSPSTRGVSFVYS